MKEEEEEMEEEVEEEVEEGEEAAPSPSPPKVAKTAAGRQAQTLWGQYCFSFDRGKL